MRSRMGRVLVLVVGLVSCACLLVVPGQAATFTMNSTADATETPLQVQWCEQDLQDWRQRRDRVDYQIAEIDARLKDSKLTEADRKALEDQKWKLKQERNSIDEWIKWIFERLIHGACAAHNTGNDLQAFILAEQGSYLSRGRRACPGRR